MNFKSPSSKISTPPKAGFTLIELLIVIGVLAILATVVVLVLNPTEMFKQARDSQRLSETDALNQAILLYQTNGGTNLGESIYIYISIATSTSDCGYTSENNPLNLPNPTPRIYRCASPTNYRKIDGFGWVPINFTNLSIQSPLTILPIDPVNTVTNGYYYTYAPGSWELTTAMESAKYQTEKGRIVQVGTEKNITPAGLRVANRPPAYQIPQTGLVAYWKFDEGSGTTVKDSSVNGNNGTLYAGTIACLTPGGTCPSWDTGKVNGGLKFDGANYSNQAVLVPDKALWNFGSNDFTIMFWVNTTSTANQHVMANKYGDPNNCWYIKYNSTQGWSFGGGGVTGEWHSGYNPSQGQWHFVVYARRGNTLFLNIDGVDVGNESVSTVKYIPYSLGIGNNGWPEGQPIALIGTIDEVAIYNRGLSSAEILAIYNGQK